MRLTRRKFLQGAALALAAGPALPIHALSAAPSPPRSFVQTVLGPVRPDQLGFCLPHEHVLCDFIGADKTARERWITSEVVKTMRPYLEQIRRRGVRAFVDCTPAYIGRDPRILRQLARETGLHVLTNTGYYGGAGDKFVPKHAYAESAEQLAQRWMAEWKNGIEDTGIKPGFIKIGIDEVNNDATRLSEIDAKLVRASAQASRATGLAAACHTGGGRAGLLATQLFLAENGKPERFIVAHSDGHGLAVNRQIADLGAWVSLDGVGNQPVEKHVQLLKTLVEKHADRLLLSMDAGWYWVGEPGGGKVRAYTDLTEQLLPALRKSGVSRATIQKLTVTNAARAFAISV